jgi:hypothetical protein
LEIAQLDIDSIELPSQQTGTFTSENKDPKESDIVLCADGIPPLLILHFERRKGDQSRLLNRGAFGLRCMLAEL